MAKITSTHASLQASIDKLEVYIMLGKYENWKLIKVIQIEHCYLIDLSSAFQTRNKLN